MKVHKEIDLEFFDESDWEFDKCQDLEFFGEDLSGFYKEPVYKGILKKTLFVLWWILSFLGVMFTAIVVALKTTNYGSPDPNGYNNLQTIEEASDTLERINGVSASSDDLIEVSKLLGEYTHILSTERGYDSLGVLCQGGSDLYSYEKSCREQSSYSLDEYDCKSRAIRGIASKVSLHRINDLIIDENGNYYCYVTLNIPDEESLFEYYLRYSYELTQFFSVKGVSMTSVSEYIDQSIGYSDFPVVSKEFLFELEECDGSLVLASDSQISSLCDDVLNSCVFEISSILGSRLSVENID